MTAEGWGWGDTLARKEQRTSPALQEKIMKVNFGMILHFEFVKGK